MSLYYFFWSFFTVLFSLVLLRRDTFFKIHYNFFIGKFLLFIFDFFISNCWTFEKNFFRH